MATLQDLMGAGIPAGLLDPQQQQALEQRARNQGLLNLGFAVLQASQGQPGQGKPRLGQIIAQAGPAFGQAYQGAFDKTLTDILRAQQIQDMQRKRQAEVQRQTAIEQLRPTLSGQDRLLFEAAPSEFIGEQLKSRFAVPKQPEYSDMFKNAAITLYGTDKGPFTDEQRQAIEKKANEYRIEPQVAAAKATAAANLRDPLRLQESARQIQRDFGKDIDPDYQVADRFNIIADNIKNPTPIGDTAIIYSLAKIINPGEAIMEGDIRNILSNRSIPDSVKQAAQKAVSGENLTENERIEIQSVAWTIVQERKNRLDRKTSQTARQLENLQQKPADYITNPYDRVSSPDQLVVNFKGKKTVANKAADGQYYVQQGNEFFRVVR